MSDQESAATRRAQDGSLSKSLRLLAAQARSEQETWWLWDSPDPDPDGYGPMLAFARAATPEAVTAALDEANIRAYQAISRAKDNEAAAREAIKLAREVYGWAVHEPNTRRLREATKALEARLTKRPLAVSVPRARVPEPAKEDE